MPITLHGDLVIYDDQFFSGAYEVIQQNIEAFGPPSNNTLLYATQFHEGDWKQRSFFRTVAAGLIARRDPSIDQTVASTRLEQDETVAPKLSRRIGPVRSTEDAFRRIGSTPEEMSLILGQQAGPEMFRDAIDSGVMACESALAGVSQLNVSQARAIQTTDLFEALRAMGDAAQRVQCWVMRSEVFWTLVTDQYNANVVNVSDIAVAAGVAQTVGRPVIVTDASSLVIPGSVPEYITLGLTADAITVQESQEQTIDLQRELGQENINMILQGEYCITTGVKGFRFTGSANPTAASLGSSANWTRVASDVKSCAGVRLVTQ